MDQFRALVVDKDGLTLNRSIQTLRLEDLPEGDVTIRVAYSGVNYKDGLACSPDGGIVRQYPFVPGIDLAGTVEASASDRFQVGDEVLVTGYGLGVSHFGGFSEMARVPAAWVVPLPQGLTLREAMIIGTAGFTAALSVYRLLANGVERSQGPVLVTGATGGVGSLAVAILARLGFEVTASTGKAGEADYLRRLGAKEVIGRSDVLDASAKPLLSQRWAAAVDPVGGATLASILRTLKYGGSVAVSGLTGGTGVETTVHPFILRGISLLGIDSVSCPAELRLKVWQLLGSDWKPDTLELMPHEIGLDALPSAAASILKGELVGRTIVRL